MTDLALPPGGVLLHIGPPKTGTTAIQAVGFRNRAQWLEAGVRYPGTTFNHRVAVSALMGRTTGWGSGEKLPGIGAWKKLQAEIDADPERRVLVSSEFVSECDDAQARRFADALGGRLHIAVTVRGYAATLTSSWQELVKVGSRHPFENWLRGVLADPPDLTMSPTFQRRSDLGLVVGRWVSLLGPDRVTVIVGDKARPAQLLDAFADLLGLPYEAMRVREQEDTLRNRSLSLPEAEMIRAMNVIVRSHEGASSSTYYDTFVRGGAVARMQHMRRPGPAEPGVLLPEWAAGRAAARARAYVAAVEATKCRVVGDLAAVLCAPVPTCPALPAVHYVPVEAAAEALAGAFSGAMGKRAFFGQDLGQVKGGTTGGGTVPAPAVSRRDELRKAYRATAEVATPTLVAVVAARQWLKLKARARRDPRVAKVLARVRSH
jgi:hypothetical protein